MANVHSVFRPIKTMSGPKTRRSECVDKHHALISAIFPGTYQAKGSTKPKLNDIGTQTLEKLNLAIRHFYLRKMKINAPQSGAVICALETINVSSQASRGWTRRVPRKKGTSYDRELWDDRLMGKLPGEENTRWQGSRGRSEKYLQNCVNRWDFRSCGRCL